MPKWAAITTSISPITARTSTWARSRPTSSRRSRRPRSSTLRLPPSADETDPRAWPNRIAPAAPCGYQARPAAIASPMTAGRHYFTASLEVLDRLPANSFSQADGLEPPGIRSLNDGLHLLHLGISAKRAAILLLPIALAACAGSDEARNIAYTDDRGVANQPYPNNYRAELPAFMKTYLNNPAGVHDAAMADPVQRTVGGRLRYVSCLRFTPRESDGSYREFRERAILYVNGRLDRIVENASDPCAGAVYAPFPELEKMTR